MKKLGILMLCTVIILIIGCSKGDDDAMGGKTKTEYMLDYMKEKYDEEFVVDKFCYEVPTSIGDEWYIHVKDHPEIEAYVVGGQYESDEYVINDNYYHVMNMKAYEEIADEVVGKELDEFHVFVDENINYRVTKSVNGNTAIEDAFSNDNGLKFDNFILTSMKAMPIDECEIIVGKILESYHEKGIDPRLFIKIYDEEGYRTIRKSDGSINRGIVEIAYLFGSFDVDSNVKIKVYLNE